VGLARATTWCGHQISIARQPLRVPRADPERLSFETGSVAEVVEI
jgi:hypothetical protein